MFVGGDKIGAVGSRRSNFQEIIDENSARGGRLQALAQSRQMPDRARRLVPLEARGRAGQCASARTQASRDGRRGGRKPGQALLRPGGKGCSVQGEEAPRRRGDQVFRARPRGPVAESIVREARLARCDLIMIGTRGMNAAANLLLGSCANRVVNISPIPVLLVK